MTYEEINRAIYACTRQYDSCDKCPCNKLSRRNCKTHLIEQAGVLIEAQRSKLGNKAYDEYMGKQEFGMDVAQDIYYEFIKTATYDSGEFRIDQNSVGEIFYKYNVRTTK